MLQTIDSNIFKVQADSNIYILKFDEIIIIDAGNRDFNEEVKKSLLLVIDTKDVKTVIFTHLHYDHIGNFDLFPNARFYAGDEEISALKDSKIKTILDKDIAKMFDVNLNPVEHIADKLEMLGLEVIKTPGHTIGSICLWYPSKRILFSGDTLFDVGCGRTDLPTSLPEEMDNSLTKVSRLRFKVLCPGHDY